MNDIFRSVLILALSMLCFASAEAQTAASFSIWASKNEGGHCIRATGSYGNAQIMNVCAEPVSIAYCNSAKCGNFQYVATLPPKGYFTFSGRGASMHACKPGLTAVLGRERSQTLCLPSRITMLRYLDPARCFSEAIGPDRKFYIMNHCTQARWFAYCSAIDGACKRYDKMLLAEPRKYVAVTTAPEIAQLTVCDQGGQPQLDRKSLVGSVVTCR